MATRAKTPPSKAEKSKKSAVSKAKPEEKAKTRAKAAKPASPPPPAKKTTSKLPKTIKSKKSEAPAEVEAIKEVLKPVVEEKAIPKKKIPSKAAPIAEVDEMKPAKSVRKVKPEILDDDDDDGHIIDMEEKTPGKNRKKAVKDLDDDDDDLDADEIDDDEDGDDEDRPARGRKKDGAKKVIRARKRSATEEFLEEDMEEVEEVEDVEILDDLDPFSSALILDPELAGPPPAPVSQLPPRPKRLAPRMQTCADCRQQYGWLSIEKVCFNCLKKRVAQRKKDEDYSGYGGSDDSGGDDDY
ncbi:MAG: hypothetical protein IPP40_08345 [bacterium]|nr:hypothetical protein [bacterium]